MFSFSADCAIRGSLSEINYGLTHFGENCIVKRSL